MLTFGNLKTLARSFAKDDAEACTDTLVQMFVNDLLMPDLLLRSGGGWLYDEHTFTSVASTAEYAMPSRFFQPLVLWDTTNENELTLLGPRDEHGDPDRSDTTTPDAFKYSYLRQVQAQPSTASVLSLSSASTSDITTYTVRITGLDANDTEISETVTLTGQTAVDTTNTYTEIWTVAKNQASNGIVTMTSNSAAVTNLRLAADELSRDHQWIRLVGVPASAINYRMDFLRAPGLVSNDGDRLSVPRELTNAVALHLEFLIKKFFYDQTDEKVMAAYLEQIELAKRLGKTPADRWVHGEVAHFSSSRSQLYQPPLAGRISRRAT